MELPQGSKPDEKDGRAERWGELGPGTTSWGCCNSQGLLIFGKKIKILFG